MKVETLKQALYNTIHKHPRLSLEAIAEDINMSTSYLARAALPDTDMDERNTSGVRFPLKQLAPLIRATGDFQILDYIENSLGRVAVEIPTNKDTCFPILRDAALTAAAEFGDLMQEITKSCEDGEVSEAERDRITKEGWEAITAIVSVIKGLER